MRNFLLHSKCLCRRMYFDRPINEIDRPINETGDE